MERNILENTILTYYPSYTKKAILQLAVNDGIIINNVKNIGQTNLNFTSSIDVSEDENIDDKYKHIKKTSTVNENIYGLIEDYEYIKPYRHFTLFKLLSINPQKIEGLVSNKTVNVFDRKSKLSKDDCIKPTIFVNNDKIFFKFSYILQNDTKNSIKHVILAIIDANDKIIDIRFDRVGIAYKNSRNYYKDKINEILEYLQQNIELKFENIDFKAIVDYMKSAKNDVTIFAQRMTRNGTTAYLEAYEEEASIIPILGELDYFIEQNNDLFNKNIYTQEIKNKLQEFKNDIEEKSDLPLVKIRLDESGIKFGITHNYKGTDYSLFMIYGELIRKELMDNVRDFIIRSYYELNKKL